MKGLARVVAFPGRDKKSALECGDESAGLESQIPADLECIPSRFQVFEHIAAVLVRGDFGQFPLAGGQPGFLLRRKQVLFLLAS